MRFMAVIHGMMVWDLESGETKGWLCYDVFYKKSFWDKLRGAKVTIGDLEYKAEGCHHVQDILSKGEGEGWRYLCSGDTYHKALKMGLRDENDLDGLKRYLRKRFKGIEIHLSPYISTTLIGVEDTTITTIIGDNRPKRLVGREHPVPKR